jgi:hypothetical protein
MLDSIFFSQMKYTVAYHRATFWTHYSLIKLFASIWTTGKVLVEWME